jgi:hypothetical protein
MNSRFGDHGLQVVHTCKDGAKFVGPADQLFYDVEPGHQQEKEQLQRIRDTRSKHKKDTIGGKILTCRNCDELFTPNDMIKMALDCH